MSPASDVVPEISQELKEGQADKVSADAKADGEDKVSVDFCEASQEDENLKQTNQAESPVEAAEPPSALKEKERAKDAGDVAALEASTPGDSGIRDESAELSEAEASVLQETEAVNNTLPEATEPSCQTEDHAEKKAEDMEAVQEMKAETKDEKEVSADATTQERKTGINDAQETEPEIAVQQEQTDSDPITDVLPGANPQQEKTRSDADKGKENVQQDTFEDDPKVDANQVELVAMLTNLP